MFAVIEITRGDKPKGNCLLFGHTIDKDFYIKVKQPYASYEKYSYFKIINNVFARKNFIKSDQLPLFKAFSGEGN